MKRQRDKSGVTKRCFRKKVTVLWVLRNNESLFCRYMYCEGRKSILDEGSGPKGKG